jgi:hypothetical protein
MDRIGQIIETIPKVAGYNCLKEQGVDPPPADHIIRTQIGSPDFLRLGIAAL